MKCCEALLAYACQDDELTINCHDKVIHIINANYGRLGKDLCPDNIGDENLECVNNQTPDIVRQR